ncbi:unnamed protein product [Moneuplotes crassus]|uniref:AP2/ERF domain-containing protein n=1 Tax=Euplotes crassus TaxID=5936 RepID=A0AAD1U3X8_EUPCR|nr:unnamed protein product [Moneuplotes crassus]
MNFCKHCSNIPKDSLLDRNSCIALKKLCKTSCVCSVVSSSCSKTKRGCSEEDQCSPPCSNNSKKFYNLGCVNQEEGDSSVSHELNKMPPKIEPRMTENSSEENELFVRVHKDVSTANKVVKPRRRRSWKLDITDRLPIIKKIILSKPVGPFLRSTKKTRYTTDKYLGRRSKYIGVTKNNVNWQALINVNHEKKYIGTFSNEIEAAKTYDLYAVAMQGKRARLNFSYTNQEMVNMIDHYLAHKSIKINEDLQ